MVKLFKRVLQIRSSSSIMASPTGNPELDNWIRIIEYIAKFKTELWMLHDVFEMGPKQLPDNLGEETNEMVAFRCLASLFDSSNDVTSDANSKIEFDSSQSCQHVLQCLLDEIPLSELKPGSPGLSKWNVLPFIKSKLLCLPKCALELMVETYNEEDGEVSPCLEEEGMRVDPESFGNGDNEISRRSHALFEESNHGSEDGAAGNRYRCVQCNESGKLLFCSREECAVMVHEKCVVDSPPVYDDAGNFYCSLCALSCVSDEYLQSQEEVAKAKKKLVSFLSLMSNVNEKKSH